jgi:hypothetical protein
MRKVELKARALCAGVSITLILRNYRREKLYKIAHRTRLSTDIIRKVECPPVGVPSDATRARCAFRSMSRHTISCTELPEGIVLASRQSTVTCRGQSGHMPWMLTGDQAVRLI